MPTTVMIDDDAHILLMRKQIEIKERYRIKKPLADITAAAIRAGINQVEKELGII